MSNYKRFREWIRQPVSFLFCSYPGVHAQASLSTRLGPCLLTCKMRRSPTWLLRRVEESFKAALVHRGPLTEAQDIYGVGKELYIGLGVNLVKPGRRTLEL